MPAGHEYSMRCLTGPAGSSKSFRLGGSADVVLGPTVARGHKLLSQEPRGLVLQNLALRHQLAIY